MTQTVRSVLFFLILVFFSAGWLWLLLEGSAPCPMALNQVIHSCLHWVNLFVCIPVSTLSVRMLLKVRSLLPPFSHAVWSSVVFMNFSHLKRRFMLIKEFKFLTLACCFVLHLGHPDNP